jgi:hypothetical protein
LYWLLTEARNPESFLTAETMTSFWSFQQMGHCAVAVLLAAVAGLVGSYVTVRRDAKEGERR